MSKFTAGPWDLKKSGDGKCYIISSKLGEEDYYVDIDCYVDSDDKEPDVAKANAQLISTAPELYKACKLALKILKKDCRNELKDIMFIEDALSKAESR